MCYIFSHDLLFIHEIQFKKYRFLYVEIEIIIPYWCIKFLNFRDKK